MTVSFIRFQQIPAKTSSASTSVHRILSVLPTFGGVCGRKSTSFHQEMQRPPETSLRMKLVLISGGSCTPYSALSISSSWKLKHHFAKWKGSPSKAKAMNSMKYVQYLKKSNKRITHIKSPTHLQLLFLLCFPWSFCSVAIWRPFSEVKTTQRPRTTLRQSSSNLNKRNEYKASKPFCMSFPFSLTWFAATTPLVLPGTIDRFNKER